MIQLIIDEAKRLAENLWRVVVPAVVVAVVTGLTAAQVPLSGDLADGHWAQAVHDLAPVVTGAVTAAIQAAKGWVHRETG